MYTCPGSIELERGRIIWQREQGDDGLRTGAVEADIDFLDMASSTPRTPRTPRAFVRFEHGIIRVSTLKVVGGVLRFREVLTLPAGTPLHEIIEVVLNLLRLGVDGQED